MLKVIITQLQINLKAFLIQKFDKEGNLLAQTKEGIDTAVNVYYAALNISKDQSVYTATSYAYYFARNYNCISRFTLKNINAGADDNVNSINLAPLTSMEQSNTIFPNPAHDIIHLPASVIKGSPYTYYLFNALGKQALSGQHSASQNAIDIRRLANGFYVIKIIAGKEQYTYKLIKD